MQSSRCALCKNFEPIEEFEVDHTYNEDGYVSGWYHHPHCAKCRALLESFGISQHSPWST